MKAPHDEEKLLIWLQLFCFILSFLIGTTFEYFSEPVSETLLKINAALYITGIILLAVKLAREGWDIAAAGFTILAIGWGAFFASLDFSDQNVGAHIFVSGFYFILPSTLLIATYKPFPWWIKALLIWCNVPFFMLLQTVKTVEDISRSSWVPLGFASLHITSVIFGIFFLMQYRKAKKGKP
ncbi:MAG: hypothetical protein IPH12_12645 [Saprospirales bacterium]|jgi:uncharacterized membrane protein AbrB (regulator of aidB expression)|nr:hypothetical protein [Saprospirales bacterium]MBK8921207.1 hypothetical protein [Saprospirales bacterium]